MKKIICAILGMTMCLGLVGCQESDTANHNLRVDANNFKISRKVVALNGTMSRKRTPKIDKF